jgi:hypothetical protein
MNVLECVESVIRNKVPGDLIEVGVWKGGVIIAMALKCIQMNEYRTIHAYDTFCGMTNPTVEDRDYTGKNAQDILSKVMCISSFADTKANIDRVAPYPLILYHIGDVVKMDISTIAPRIAVLRLDTDWYESTKFELAFFEPNVQPQGFVIVDDAGHWMGAKKALEEHCKQNNISKVHSIDYTGVYYQKGAM